MSVYRKTDPDECFDKELPSVCFHCGGPLYDTFIFWMGHGDAQRGPATTDPLFVALHPGCIIQFTGALNRDRLEIEVGREKASSWWNKVKKTALGL